MIRNFIEKKLSERKNLLNGYIYGVGDGIRKIFGLDSIMAGELLYFPADKSYGIAFNLEYYGIGAVLLTEGRGLKEGDLVEPRGRLANLKVTSEIMGSVVNGFGFQILEQPSKPKFLKEGIIGTQAFEAAAPSIMSRYPVKEPLHRGVLAIDCLIPIGRGQRELLIGDRQRGKTQIAIDRIKNLSNQYTRDLARYKAKTLTVEPKPVICIYVAVGQRASQVAELRKTLLDENSLNQVVIVSARASSRASIQYLAPFTGRAIAEAFMLNLGFDRLIIYDDLSRHAQAYREMALLLRRPPGREAYPGDIFYVHARLLERSAKIAVGGSLRALPIIERLANDISAYIPTNVISITDGQVFFSRELFNEGIRPALDIGLSVSRVGSAAQPKKISKLTSKLKLVLAQYRELKVFSQFSSVIDAEAQAQLDQGQLLTKLFIQKPLSPYPEYLQFAIVWAFGSDYTIEINTIDQFIKEVQNELSMLKVNDDQTQDDLSKLAKNFILAYEASSDNLEQSIKDFFELFFKRFSG